MLRNTNLVLFRSMNFLAESGMVICAFVRRLFQQWRMEPREPDLHSSCSGLGDEVEKQAHRFDIYLESQLAGLENIWLAWVNSG